MIAVQLARPGESGRIPLVLLHAFPLDSRMWDEVVPLIGDGVPVLTVDLPGMGGAPDPTEPPSVEVAADAVAEALRGHGPAVVAGLSMGGYIALALAERHPDLVAALGLLDTKALADAPDAAANRLRIADEVRQSGTVDAVRPMATSLLGDSTRAARPALVARVGEWIGQQRPVGVAWSQRAMAARPDRTGLLRGWDRPALVLVGAEDGPTPPSVATETAQLLGIEPVVVPAAGHLTAIEDPAAVARALNDLVEAV